MTYPTADRPGLDDLVGMSVDTLKHFEKQQAVIDACPIRVYSASYMTYPYPFKLQHVERGSAFYRRTAVDYILDSGFKNDEVTNAELLDRADELNATYVVPKDYPGDPGRTTDSVWEFLDLFDSHPAKQNGVRAILPTHAPHAEHVLELPDWEYYAVGGIKQLPADEQVEILREFREAVGYGPKVHAFGMGANLPFVRAIRDDPRLVESVDLATHELSVINNVIPDKSLTQVPFALPRGKLSSAVRETFAAAVLLMLNYLMSPYCTDAEVEGDEPALPPEPVQTELGGYAD